MKIHSVEAAVIYVDRQLDKQTWRS